MTTKYTKIITNSILLKFNCVVQFDRCCKDWDKVTVTFLICIWKTELYWWRWNILKSSLIVYCWNLVATHNLTGVVKTEILVTVTFVTCSGNILIYELQKWEQLHVGSGYSVSLKNKDFRPQGLHFRLVGLRLRPQGLGSSVFVFHTSLTALQSQE